MWFRQQPVRVERPTPPPQTSRSANGALTPSAIQHLQRTIGNRAVGQLLRRAAVGRMSSGTAPKPRSSPPRRMRSRASAAGATRRGRRAIQRVGGEKIGFDLLAPTDPTIKAGQDLLVEQWRQIRQTEHDLKAGTEKTDVEEGARELIAHHERQKQRDAYRKDRTKDQSKRNTALPVIGQGRTAVPAPGTTTGPGFTKYYYNILTDRKRTEQITLLKAKAPAFADYTLTIDDATGVIQYRPDPTQPDVYVTIGTLKKGAGAFTVKTAATATGREVLEKQGVSTNLSGEAKEYVTDTRGVMTRRYAYVEKNYWQMMEFFMTSRHEGRFQSFMKAAGEPNPDLFEAREPEVDIVRGKATPKKTKRLTQEQLAVAHQKLGSGPQQRGVSLTSTPKVGATYVNTGQNFRTDHGFRLKIDLALIPPHPAGPLLINHYSHGGVIDQPAMYDTTRERGKASKYPYKESSVHARELYLEYLMPEWVVAIESHPTVTGPSTTIASSPHVTPAALFQLGKLQFGGASFESGFDEGLRKLPNSLPGDTNHTDGFKHAGSFVRGWDAGHAKHALVGANDATEATTARITVAQYVYDKSMAVDLPKDEFDIYRMGYLQGRSGVALIAAGANLPH